MLNYLCKNCGNSFPRWNSAQTLCQLCQFNKYAKPRKPLKRLGRRGREYIQWRNQVARPALMAKSGLCELCGTKNNLDVDHIKKRGSHPELLMSLDNVRLLCRACHIKTT